MGSLSYYRRFNDSVTAMENATKTIVYFPTFAPAYVERLYIMLEQSSWEQISEASQRVFQIDDNCIDALFLLAIKDLCLGKELGEIVSYLSTLEKTVEKKEPANAHLCYNIARVISRLAGRHKEYA
jgi:tetratricopeptide repeat protein 21B